MFLLDAFFEIVIWVGHEARYNHKDIQLAMITSMDYSTYVSKIQAQRLLNTESTSIDVSLVISGEETAAFKGNFIAFDDGSDDLSEGGGFVSYTLS